MGSLALLFCLLAAGYLFGSASFGKKNAPRVSRALNRWIIRVALPALVFQKIHSLPEFSISQPEIYLPVSQPWLQFSLALLVVSIFRRFLNWSLSVWGALVMTVGLGNTSFVGLPLLSALIGPESLATGIIQDQLGSFLILSLIGIPLIQTLSGALRSSKSSNAKSWRRIFEIVSRPLRFPAFIALILSVLLSSWSPPILLDRVIYVLAWTLSPAALLSVGMMLNFSELARKEIRNPLLLGLALKLLVFPAFYFWLYPQWSIAAGGVSPLVLQTLLLESAMASQITGGLLTADEGIAPELARLMVGVSIPLSLITVSLWNLLFAHLGY